MSRREKAEQRILDHARRGYRLAMTDAAYLATVRRRLSASLAAEPTDLWEAIDWTWAVTLGQTRAEGPLAEPIERAADVLRAILEGDDAAARRWVDACADRLSLGSTVRSHPFPDQASWLLRKTSLAS